MTRAIPEQCAANCAIPVDGEDASQYVKVDTFSRKCEDFKHADMIPCQM